MRSERSALEGALVLREQLPKRLRSAGVAIPEDSSKNRAKSCISFGVSLGAKFLEAIGLIEDLDDPALFWKSREVQLRGPDI